MLRGGDNGRRKQDQGKESSKPTPSGAPCRSDSSPGDPVPRVATSPSASLHRGRGPGSVTPVPRRRTGRTRRTAKPRTRRAFGRLRRSFDRRSLAYRRQPTDQARGGAQAALLSRTPRPADCRSTGKRLDGAVEQRSTPGHGRYMIPLTPREQDTRRPPLHIPSGLACDDGHRAAVRPPRKLKKGGLH